ncbi:MAG: septal ring lytic transglycosylase RlpA family protein [Deltaproteobacteria bacterium]|nr:septal ring lytic transglycosylase RlpA family protein [Deltaproteobacteria bacterium]
MTIMTSARRLWALFGFGGALLPLLLASCGGLISHQEAQPVVASASSFPPPFQAKEAAAKPEGQKVEQVGIASWYGPGFHGRETASGETFDQNALTAAHRSLPLGSMAMVTSLETGKSVQVKINDRGPYVKGRKIDLSRAAAQKIGLKKGVIKVKITATPQRKATKKPVRRVVNTSGASIERSASVVR